MVYKICNGLVHIDGELSGFSAVISELGVIVYGCVLNIVELTLDVTSLQCM